MRSVEWALIQYDRCPCKKRETRHRDTQGECHVMIETEMGAKQGQPKEHWGSMATPIRQEGARKVSTRSLRGSMVLPTPCFGTLSLGNSESIDVCCFRPSPWHHRCSCPISQAKSHDQDQNPCGKELQKPWTPSGPQYLTFQVSSSFHESTHSFNRLYEYLLEAKPCARH